MALSASPLARLLLQSSLFLLGATEVAAIRLSPEVEPEVGKGERGPVGEVEKDMRAAADAELDLAPVAPLEPGGRFLESGTSFLPSSLVVEEGGWGDSRDKNR